MKMRRIFVNISLLIGLGFSIYILVVTFTKFEWNTVAATLAVITAILSTWMTQRIIWKQEDDLEPSLNTYLDLKSRHGLIQFVIENNGGSTAYDLKIVWEKPLLDLYKNEVHFNQDKNKIDIPIINKGQRLSVIVKGSLDAFKEARQTNEEMDYFGKILFKKSKKSKKILSLDFYVSLEPYKRSLTFDSEEVNFYYEGAKIHKDLVDINASLKELNDNLNNKASS